MWRQLSEAMDDEDLDRLSSLLPAANRLGIWSEEFERAQRMVNFRVQKQLLSELESVRAIVTGLTDSVRLIRADQSKGGKGGDSAQMSESWLKMVRDTVCEGIDHRVVQVVQSAVSEATKDLLLECRGFRESKPVQHQVTNAPKRTQSTTTALPKSSEAGKIAKRESELLKQKTGKTCSSEGYSIIGFLCTAPPPKGR